MEENVIVLKNDPAKWVFSSLKRVVLLLVAISAVGESPNLFLVAFLLVAAASLVFNFLPVRVYMEKEQFRYSRRFFKQQTYQYIQGNLQYKYINYCINFLPVGHIAYLKVYLPNGKSRKLFMGNFSKESLNYLTSVIVQKKQSHAVCQAKENAKLIEKNTEGAIWNYNEDRPTLLNGQEIDKGGSKEEKPITSFLIPVKEVRNQRTKWKILTLVFAILSIFQIVNSFWVVGSRITGIQPMKWEQFFTHLGAGIVIGTLAFLFLRKHYRETTCGKKLPKKIAFFKSYMYIDEKKYYYDRIINGKFTDVSSWYFRKIQFDYEGEKITCCFEKPTDKGVFFWRYTAMTELLKGIGFQGVEEIE